jgi:hypothetical protein
MDAPAAVPPRRNTAKRDMTRPVIAGSVRRRAASANAMMLDQAKPTPATGRLAKRR